ncbi:ABC transporter substrate-binding protein [Anaeropeptidivorans aminofermentans]|uniref:ABC transporter substrate-binding protein n=1 Tax=Anaeropeptidivorans aminofermentans TaxID=2934315 RepID=UPI002025860C|nr:ABC transporter substrate-binding protein [Anaeropeptidivorans aminofermentans]
MKKILGLFVLMSIITGILFGCSGNSSTNQPSAAPSPAASIPPEEKEEPSEEKSADASPSENQESQWPRTFTDSAGNEITLEKKPEKIAVLHATYLEYFFALDTPPYASSGSRAGDAMATLASWETLKPYAGTAKLIDIGSSLNLEALLEVGPDVIVAVKGQRGLDEVYDRLIQICPVVQVDFSTAWQEQTRACAQIVGQEEYAESLIKDVEAGIASARDELENYADKTIAILQSTDGKSVISRGTKAYYDSFALSKPEGYPEDYAALSLEAIADMNPDYIVFQGLEFAQVFVDSQANSTVWQSMDAVINDNVYFFDDSLNTSGPLAMKLVAEKLLDIYKN